MGNFEARLERSGDLDSGDGTVDVTNRSNCPLCIAGEPGRHPDHGGTHAARHPRCGDPVILYSDRRTILAITDRGGGPLIVAEDADGFRIERRVAALVWSADERAWR